MIVFTEIEDGDADNYSDDLEFEGTNCVVCSTCIGPHLEQDYNTGHERAVWTLVWRSGQSDLFCESCVIDIEADRLDDFTTEQIHAIGLLIAKSRT